MRKKGLLLAALFIVVAFYASVRVSGAAAAQEQGALRPIRYAQVLMNPAAIDMYVAQQKGFFAKEGIKINLTTMEDVVKPVQALLAGAVDVISTSVDIVISAVKGGAGLAIVAGQFNEAPQTLITSKDIKKYADLRGKVLGVPTKASGSALLLKAMLSEKGLKEKDYQMMEVGGSSNRLAALQRGAISGTLLQSPADFRAEAAGYTKLGTVPDLVHYAWQVYVVKRSWAVENKDTLIRFLKAVHRAQDWLRKSQNRKEAVEILAKQTRMKSELAAKILDLEIDEVKGIPIDGRIPKLNLANVGKLMVANGAIDHLPAIQQYTDFSYNEEAER